MDSVTPFRQGRWLTGLSGSIDSNNLELRSSELETTSNEFGLSLIGGSFFKDRWLVGGIIQANRSDAEGVTDLTTETLFIGPKIARYLSDSPRGSLYVFLSPGYARYRNFISLRGDALFSEETSEGSGFGFLVSLGYAYVVFDRIVFDIGIVLGQSWVDLERELQPEDLVISDNIAIRNISFSFGFRVLLDKFLE